MCRRIGGDGNLDRLPAEAWKSAAAKVDRGELVRNAAGFEVCAMATERLLAAPAPGQWPTRTPLVQNR